jgi:Cys-tRNA(Pro) deacylase
MSLQTLNSSDLENFLKDHCIQGQVLHLGVMTPTVEKAAEALGVSTSEIVKSLLFLLDGEPMLAVGSGTACIDNRQIAAEFGVGRKHIKLAPSDTVIQIAGYLVGAMPPFGHRKKLQTLIDPAVMEHETVYAGGGDENAMMRIQPQELLRVTEGKILRLQEKQAESSRT